MNNPIYFLAIVIFLLIQSCSGSSHEDNQDVTKIESEGNREIDEFYSLTTDSSGIYTLPLDKRSYLFDEAEIVPLYHPKKDTLYYSDKSKKLKKNLKIIFPENFNVDDTAIALIYFSGWKDSTIPDRAAVLIGNFKKRPTIIVDYNNNLDFSDDDVLENEESDQGFSFKLKNSEKDAFVKVEIDHINWEEAYDREESERRSKGANSLDHPIVDSDFWFDVKRINFKTAKYIVNNDSAYIALIDGSGDGLYDDKNWDKILIANRDINNLTLDLANDAYLPKEQGFFIEINENTFEVVEIEPTGAYIKIKEAPKKNIVSRLKEGTLVPDFSFTTFSGSSQNIYSITSKKNYTLLQFWGAWCKPCVANIPKLLKIESQYKNLSVVGFNAYDSNEKAIKFIKNKKIPWLNGFANEEILDVFDVNSFPTYILISGDNKVYKRLNNLNELELFLQEN